MTCVTKDADNQIKLTCIRNSIILDFVWYKK